MFQNSFIAGNNSYSPQAETLEQGDPFRQIQYTELERHNMPGNFQAEWDQLLASRKKYIYGAFAKGYQTYSEMRPLYQARGIHNPAKYLIDNINGIEFFGHKTIGHIELRDRLRVAENRLKQQNRVPTIIKFWSFNPRRIGASTKLSKHALGRAVDINPDTNPHIINKDDIRVIYGVTGVNLGQKQPASAMQQASLVFKSKFTQQWIKMQTREIQNSISRRKRVLDKYAKTGFLNLEQSLIDALKAAGIKWGGDWIHVKDFMHFEI